MLVEPTTFCCWMHRQSKLCRKRGANLVCVVSEDPSRQKYRLLGLYSHLSSAGESVASFDLIHPVWVPVHSPETAAKESDGAFFLRGGPEIVEFALGTLLHGIVLQSVQSSKQNVRGVSLTIFDGFPVSWLHRRRSGRVQCLRQER